MQLQSAEPNKELPNKEKTEVLCINAKKNNIEQGNCNGFFISNSQRHIRPSDSYQTAINTQLLSLRSLRREEEDQKDELSSVSLNSNSFFHNNNPSESFYNSQSSSQFTYTSQVTYSTQQSGSINLGVLIRAHLEMYTDINENEFLLLESSDKKQYLHVSHDSTCSSNSVPVGSNFQAEIPTMRSHKQYTKSRSNVQKMAMLHLLKVHDPLIDQKFYKDQARFICKQLMVPICNKINVEENKDDPESLKHNNPVETNNHSGLYYDVNLLRNGYCLYVDSIGKQLQKRYQQDEGYQNVNRLTLKFREYAQLPTIGKFWEEYFGLVARNRRKRKRCRFPFENIQPTK